MSELGHVGLPTKKFLLIAAARSKTQTLKTPFQNILEGLAHKGDKLTDGVYQWPVVDLRVGTMDALYSLLEELVKSDSYIELVAKKVGRQILEFTKKDKPSDMLWDILPGVDVYKYTTKFNWEDTRFTRRKTLNELVSKIQTDVNKIENDLKIKVGEFTALKTLIRQRKKKESGSLITRDLNNIVKPSDIISTEYLTTIFVVVPNHSLKPWLSSYETLTEYVLPGSAELIFEDFENSLFRVILFKRVVDDFRQRAMERKWSVRNYEPSEGMDLGHLEKLKEQKYTMKKTLSRWCITHFADAYVCWMHLKYIRCFVESVLRFGIPLNFEMILIDTHPKSEKKIRSILEHLFDYLVNIGTETHDDVPAGVAIEDENYYPYVSLDISWDIKSDRF